MTRSCFILKTIVSYLKFNSCMKKSTLVGISVIGCGYWGPNFIRNLARIPTVTLRYICDLDKKRLEKMKRLYPMVKTTTDIKDIIKDKKTQGVIIATPVRTHYPLAKLLLEAKKHVLVEKPMTASVEHAKELLALSEKVNRILCVDHTFIYNPAVQKMKQIIKRGELGDLFYF